MNKRHDLGTHTPSQLMKKSSTQGMGGRSDRDREKEIKMSIGSRNGGSDLAQNKYIPEHPVRGLRGEEKERDGKKGVELAHIYNAYRQYSVLLTSNVLVQE